MTLQYVSRATVVVFALGVVTVGPAYAQRRDGGLLPQDQSGTVTAVGCLLRGTAVRGGGDNSNYVLARPVKGPMASTPEASCTAEPGAAALELDNAADNGVTAAMVGKWVVISGKLESETSKDPDNLRELDVASVRLVPVVVPKPAAAAPSPAPQSAPPPMAQPTPQPAPAPAAPAPEAPMSLPKTASQVPAIGLAGLLAFAGSLILRSFRLRRV